MTEILVFSLPRCKKCKYFFTELIKTEVRYSNFVCEDDSKYCDDLEDIVKCNNYPIVKIKNQGYITYLCLGEFQEILSYNDNTTIEYCTSLDQMIRKTVNHYTK